MVQLVESALRMVHAKDPKQEIFDKIGDDLSKIKVNGADYLVCVYIRPERTKGGIILADKTRDEDKHQGIVGLIVAAGSAVWRDPTVMERFDNDPPKIGEWVVFNIGDTHGIVVGETRMRLLPANYVRMQVTEPDIVI